MTTPRVGPVVSRLTGLGETAGHLRQAPSASECRGRILLPRQPAQRRCNRGEIPLAFQLHLSTETPQKTPVRHPTERDLPT